jgi:hypothetical protein
MDLFVRRGAEVLGPFRLLDGPNVAGRSEDCDILLPSRRVSRHHCVFELFGGRVTVRDLGSHNGVVGSDGRRVSNLMLRPGDEVLIGDFMVGLQESEPTQTELELDVERSGPASVGRAVRLPTEIKPIHEHLDLDEAEDGGEIEDPDDLSIGAHLVTEEASSPLDSPSGRRPVERASPGPAPTFAAATSPDPSLHRRPSPRPIAPLLLDETSHPVVLRDGPSGLPIAVGASPLAVAQPAPPPSPLAVAQPAPPPPLAGVVVEAPRQTAISTKDSGNANNTPLLIAGIVVVLASLFVEMWAVARVDESAAALATDVSAEEAQVLAGSAALGVEVTSYDAAGQAIGKRGALDADIQQEAEERGIAHIEFAGGTRAVAVSRDAAGQVKGFVGVDGPPTRSKADTTAFRALAVTQAVLGLLIVVAAAFFSRRRA